MDQSTHQVRSFREVRVKGVFTKSGDILARGKNVFTKDWYPRVKMFVAPAY